MLYTKLYNAFKDSYYFLGANKFITWQQKYLQTMFFVYETSNISLYNLITTFNVSKPNKLKFEDDIIAHNKDYQAYHLSIFSFKVIKENEICYQYYNVPISILVQHETLTTDILKPYLVFTYFNSHANFLSIKPFLNSNIFTLIYPKNTNDYLFSSTDLVWTYEFSINNGVYNQQNNHEKNHINTFYHLILDTLNYHNAYLKVDVVLNNFNFWCLKVEFNLYEYLLHHQQQFNNTFYLLLSNLSQVLHFLNTIMPNDYLNWRYRTYFVMKNKFHVDLTLPTLFPSTKKQTKFLQSINKLKALSFKS